MRKKLIYICLAVLSVTMFFTVNTIGAEDAEQKIKVYLNGEYIQFSSQEPTVVERRTLIPLRGIFEKMGYSVSWDAKTKSCVISNDIQTITMRSGHKGMQVNEQAYMLDVSAQIINDSLMIPLRAVAECTGATVTWDAPTKSVYINSNQKEQVSFSVNEYVKEYTENISELDSVNSLFRTLNSLTDRNYNSKIDTLKRQTEEAKESLDEVYLKLSEMTPPEDYSEFHKLSMEMINTVTELCNLVERMLDNDLTYDEATTEISLITEKADEINRELSSATAELNMSVYR